jgi:hypothetical protein
MTEFLLHRDKRKRKRAIYARAHKALHDLQESLRDMREFVGDIKPLYEHLGDAGNREVQVMSLLQRRLKLMTIKNNEIPVNELLSLFNNTREEIPCED